MNSDKTHQSRKNSEGFSLIEILIAVTIIVLMGGLVAVNLFPQLFRTQRDKAEIDINMLVEAVKLYQLREQGKLPNESEWPSFLFEGSKNNPAPYIDTDRFQDRKVLDPWGTEYVYRKLSSKEYEIISYGMDGSPGGEGDDADISSKKNK